MAAGDRGVLDLLEINAETPLSVTTDGKYLIVALRFKRETVSTAGCSSALPTNQCSRKTDKGRSSGLGMKVDDPVADLESPS